MKNRKTNMFDYLEWRGDLSFTQTEFNEVDGLILSVLSYLDFSGTVEYGECDFEKAVELVLDLPDEIKYTGGVMVMHDTVELAIQAAKSRRFQEMKVGRYVDIVDEELEAQFSAVTFYLPDESAFLSFRGTDNNLVGWKEDFNMSFTNGVPAQTMAAEYTRRFLNESSMPVRMGGHSKGGNLAIWAGAYQNPLDKPRILQIYSNDGPGFSKEFLDSSLYKDIRDRVSAFVPEGSIVGVMMEQDQYTTILSSNPVVWQHQPYSWLVVGTHFLYDDERNRSAVQIEKLLDSWLHSMTPEEREEFVDRAYAVITANNAKTLEDLEKERLHAFLRVQKSFLEMGTKKQGQLIQEIGKLLLGRELE